MSLDDLLDKTFGKDKAELHPPRAPIVGETSSVDRNIRVGKISQSSAEPTRAVGNQRSTDSKPTIDFSNMPNTYWKWCDRLETKRTWYHARFDKVHRGSVEDLKRDVQERDQELDMVAVMKREKKPLFREVMNEFKQKLEKLK